MEASNKFVLEPYPGGYQWSTIIIEIKEHPQKEIKTEG